jgi:glycosyltransferase involved in cell wall biosynthesis
MLYVSPWFFPAHVYGGPIESSRKMCMELANNSHEVRVLTTNANGVSVLPTRVNEKVQVDNYTARYCRRIGRRGSFSPFLVMALVREIPNCDVVHLSYTYSFPTIPTLLIAKLYGKPLLWCTRGGLQRWEGSTRVFAKRLWIGLCALVLPKTICFHATSEAELSDILARFPREKGVVIPNGFEFPPAPLLKPKSPQLRLLFLGRLDRQKGIERLLDAIALLRRRGHFHFSLVVAGPGEPGYLSELQQLAQSLSLSECVSFVGMVTGNARELLFHTSDVLILPSFKENFGNVVVEALARHVPVIASTGTPWRDLEVFNCGLWVNNTPEALADAIKRIAGMDIESMGIRGRALVMERYGLNSLVARLEKVYNRMIHEDNSASRT